ncbi:basic proline-rich protein-like [Ochotona curzoniae]|uniref:basic proline-rich protein-like n=1 Tax=Ochotona curzoniae TaxID=130825 RepID=UPI001B34F02A|nr:basic proline-rich protein-like [Ochotona curzoniae]
MDAWATVIRPPRYQLSSRRPGRGGGAVPRTWPLGCRDPNGRPSTRKHLPAGFSGRARSHPPQCDSRQPSSPHAAPLKRYPRMPPPPSPPRHGQGCPPPPSPASPPPGRPPRPPPGAASTGGAPARYARRTARAALTPPRPKGCPPLGRPRPGPRHPRPVAPTPASAPDPTTHWFRSRGSRRNSARRAPPPPNSRRMRNSGQSSVVAWRPARALRPGSSGARQSRLSGPWCSRPARCPAAARLAGANASDLPPRAFPGCGACPVRGRAGPASRATRVRLSGCSRRPGE